ncbi:MAG TPA: response regulator [Albitalea sp.]|nr:response regulator [Albitalea sp.]
MSLTLSVAIADAGEPPQAQAERREERFKSQLAARRIAPSVETAEADGTLVLVVDDHPTNRSVMLRQVQALGYAADCAEDGAEALRMWRSRRFAIILTDCHMPEMDGYELARRIRREEAGRGGEQIPIIACTANALGGEAQACLDAGMNDYLAKPIALSALMQCLDRWRPVPETVPAPLDLLAAAPQPADAPLDRSALEAISGSSADAERAILLDFRRVNDGDALMLRQAVAQTDASLATRVSHRIKGASRMVGACRLADVCEGIEASSRVNDWESIGHHMAAFQLEMQSLNAYIDAV